MEKKFVSYIGEDIIQELDRLAHKHSEDSEFIHFTERLRRFFSNLDTQLGALSNANVRSAELVVGFENEVANAQDEIILHFSRFNELSHLQKELLLRLGAIQQGIILPLRDIFSELDASEIDIGSVHHSEYINRGRKLISRLETVFKPISDLYQESQLCRNRNVLLADPDKKQQLIAKIALKGTGVRLDIASSLNEAIQAISDKDYDVLWLDNNLIELASQARQKNPNIKIVLMTEALHKGYVEILQSHPYFSNVIIKEPDDRIFTIKNITTTLKKLLSNDIFGIEKYLNWGVEVIDKEVQSSEQRSQLIEEMNEYFDSLGIKKVLQSRCCIVAEELLSNAIYDAPVDYLGKSKYNYEARTTAIYLNQDEYSTFRYACDGLFIALSITDPFGRIERNTIIEYLESCYKDNAGCLNEILGKGGAGRGIVMIIETADWIIFNVDPNKRTEVVAIFDIEAARNKKKRNAAFHYFRL